MARNSAELRPQLREAQQTLGDSLKEACAMDPSKANTGELIHIEELLAIANESAKKAISVRRRLKKDGSARDEASVSGQTSQSRVVTDGSNVTWTVMAIRPSTAKTLSGQYQSGWLAFDSGEETRRLAPIPDNWTNLPDDELTRLIAQATLAPKRKA